MKCPPRPQDNWGEELDLDASERPSWAAQYDEVDCNKYLFCMAVDYKGCDGVKQVFATVMIMFNQNVTFHVITCNPYGRGCDAWALEDNGITLHNSGPNWFIQLLRRAGVVFGFCDAEVAELHSRGVTGVWDVQARVARKANGGLVGLYEAWSGVVGVSMGVVALHKRTRTAPSTGRLTCTSG